MLHDRNAGRPLHQAEEIQMERLSVHRLNSPIPFPVCLEGRPRVGFGDSRTFHQHVVGDDSWLDLRLRHLTLRF